MSTQRIYLNAFHTQCAVHHAAGRWPHAEDKKHDYTKQPFRHAVSPPRRQHTVYS